MNNRRTYLQGLIEAEARYKATNDIIDLKLWVKSECNLVKEDYRWDEWQLGARHYIVYVENILNLTVDKNTIV